MNKEQLGILLYKLRNNTPVKSITLYAVQSIEEARSNYSVSNLMSYCNEIGIKVVVTDMATEDVFEVSSVSEIHNVLRLLMDRYNVDSNWCFRKTGVHYTPSNTDGTLSIVTLLSVCEAIYAKLDFIKTN